jgi:hypothetical protein
MTDVSEICHWNDVDDISQMKNEVTPTWTAPSSSPMNGSTMPASPEYTQNSTADTDRREAACDELPAPKQIKYRKNQNKSKNRNMTTSEFLNSDSSSSFFGVIHDSTTNVHIVKDIGQHVTHEDSCFLAIVFPSTTAAKSAPTPAESTADTKCIPDEYRDLSAAFSDSSHELLDHGPHDLEINLQGDKIPALGPLYSLSDSEQKMKNTSRT